MARKTITEMLGEALRELGVLLALFAPLEQVVVKGERLTATFVTIVVVFVGLLLGGGFAAERLRKLEE